MDPGPEPADWQHHGRAQTKKTRIGTGPGAGLLATSWQGINEKTPDPNGSGAILAIGQVC